MISHAFTTGTICCAGIFHSRWLYKQRERMLDGSTLSFNKNGHVYVAGRRAPISRCDVTATNGVVHVLDAVLPEAIKKYGRAVDRPEDTEREEVESTPSPWRRNMDNFRRQMNRHMPNFKYDLMGKMNMHWDAFLEHMREARHRLGSHEWPSMRFSFGSKKK